MTSLNSDGKRLASLVEMVEEVMEMSKTNLDRMANIQKFQNFVRRSTELIKDTRSASVVALDAKMLHTGSALISSTVSTESDMTCIRPSEYNLGILNYLQYSSADFPDEKAWRCFAPATFHLYAKSAPPVTMLGSVFSAPEPVVVKMKKERMKKVSETKAVVLADSVMEIETGNDDVEDGVYEHILKSLVKCYKTNAKKPLNFIEFIMNPNDYWISIQNIFHFSFLVRDGRVKMSINDCGLPVVEPVFGKDLQGPKKPGNQDKDKSKEANEKNRNNHFIFTLTMKQWEECVRKLKTTVAMITPIPKK